MEKIYVLDTNVLLNDHLAPLAFNEHTVVIPLIVLEELDNIKMRNNDLSRDARAAIRVLEDIVGDNENDTSKGILISECGKYDVHDNAKLVISKTPIESDDIPNDIPDNIIINTALEYQRNNDKPVILVSGDINLRLKSRGAGLKYAELYKREVCIDDTDLLPVGYFSVDIDWLDRVGDCELTKNGSCGSIIFSDKHLEQPVNVGNWLFNEEHDWAGHVDKIEGIDDFKMIQLTVKNISDMRKRKCSSIVPKTTPQALAIDALLDKDKDVVILFGGAGTGKTLLTLAASVEMVKGSKRYDVEEIIFSKTSDSQFKEMGFLPGNEHEKLSPWAGALYDNMEVISRESKQVGYHPKNSIESDKAFIKLKALNFMRGRSINRRVLVIDEAQNLNSKQMKTILSRVGNDTKIVIMGNLSQIDNDYLTENSSGLTYICQKFDKWERASIIHLDKVERSPVAEFVEENL